MAADPRKREAPQPPPDQAWDGIRVFTADPASLPAAAWPRLERLLSETERALALRFRFAANRLEYVAAHALVRLALGRCLGVPPQSLAFLRGRHGKPALARGGAFFSLSHCDGLVACAISRTIEVGIDAERIDRPAPPGVSAGFARAEQADLGDLPPARRDRRFFALWTLKEAVLKAAGEGLSRRLDEVSVGFDPLRLTACAPRLGAAGNWHLAQIGVSGTHLLGLAWHGPGAAVRYDGGAAWILGDPD